MDRKWKSGASGTPPASSDNASDGYPTAGNPGTGTPATKPGPYMFYMLVEELLALIAAAGIAFDKTVLTQVRDAVKALAVGITQTTTSTGTQNDFVLTGGVRRGILRCNNASLLTLNGFAAGADGDEWDLVSVGAGQVDLANQNAGSSAANRIINQVAATISLAPGSGFARIRYDATASRWRVIAHEQGAWITPAFSAGNFTANGSMTWTVDSGDVGTYGYWLKGRTLFVSFQLTTTTVGGTLNNELRMAIPLGLTSSLGLGMPCYINENGTEAIARAVVSAGGAVIAVSKVPQTNFAAATNTTSMSGQIAIAV